MDTYLKIPRSAAYVPSGYSSQVDLHQEQYRREYEQYQLQMQEYQKQLAEYHEKLNKYHGELQQYQMQHQYKTALDQAAFHKAYNYNMSSSQVAEDAEEYSAIIQNAAQVADCLFSLRLTLAVPMSIPDSECQWLLNNMFPAVFKWLRFIDPKKVTWTERTDPNKFVYEDCGIAAYLLEFWRKRGRTPKKFADLGCGNGLLVHLLNKEGVEGVGIDIRKRKIWSEQLAGTSLIEAVVDPSKVCLRLGFFVEEDRLSIPSTKRLCFVCTVPPQGLVPNVEDIIEELTGSSTEVFLPRSKVEQVRNCLNVPKDIRLDLTKRFFFKLLEINEEVQNGWRRGGAIELGKLAALLTPEEKQLMKQQCGGLQTFLRNQHQVFK
ncbi:hypothetical protein TELCIR_22556, partial [Teladorsagia circumcincta]